MPLYLEAELTRLDFGRDGTSQLGCQILNIHQGQRQESLVEHTFPRRVPLFYVILVH